MFHFPTRCLGVLLTVILCASAQATVIEITSLEDLASRSDLIVRGEVASAEGKMVGGHIETTIHVKVAERLKGSSDSDDLVLTQFGGSVETPIPLAQAVPGLAAFGQKEEVILFLSTKLPKVDPSLRERALAANGGKLPALWTSPKVIGGFQGKYNIYTEPTTKRRMVVRQSSLAVQGADPDRMPPEVQAKIAASLEMAEPGTENLNADGSAPAGQLTSAAPASAVPYKVFHEKLMKAIGAANAPKPAEAAGTKEAPVAAPSERVSRP